MAKRFNSRSGSGSLRAFLRTFYCQLLRGLCLFLRYKYLFPILLAFLLPSDVKTSEPSLPRKVQCLPHSGVARLPASENSTSEKLHANP